MTQVTEHDLVPQELRVLIAVAQQRGFSAAAVTLGLTQSAVSHSVKGSERKLGAVLFQRGRHGAEPTPAGERVVAHARRVLRLLDIMAAEAHSVTTGTVAGPLRIAAFRSATLYLLPPVLDRLRARHPALEPQVRVVRELSAGTAGEVLEGRADLGIATIDANIPSGLIGNVILNEPYSWIHPADHPEPRSLPLIDWAENCDSYTRQWWAKQDWIPRATIETEDDGAVLSMVATGRGMAIMPALSLTEMPPTVKATDLGPDRPTRSIGYVTTPELAATVAVRALIRELRQPRVPA